MRLPVWDTEGDPAGAVGLIERTHQQELLVLERRELEAYSGGEGD